MPVKHTNRKWQTFYLHQSVTKTGRPNYFFSMKNEGTLVDRVPDGFEIHENPIYCMVSGKRGEDGRVSDGYIEI